MKYLVAILKTSVAQTAAMRKKNQVASLYLRTYRDISAQRCAKSDKK